jgi:hypothetical protein
VNILAPDWVVEFMDFERSRGRSTDEPREDCAHCDKVIKFADRALCRSCELRFGENLIDDAPRCSGCFMPFGNPLDYGLWVEPSAEDPRKCQFCTWRNRGLRLHEMLRVIARECGLGSRSTIRIYLDLSRPHRERFRISRAGAIAKIAIGAFFHPALVEMLKHDRVSLEHASAEFLKSANRVVEAFEGEKRLAS